MKTAVIAAYRDAGFIEENAKKLLDAGFEVIVAADEPSKEILDIVERYDLKATLSDNRRGKWLALNDAAELASGDVIMFLDSDTRIRELCAENGCDAVELVKEVEGNSLLAKLVNVDYLMLFLISRMAAYFNACVGINGAAFMIKRKVFRDLGGFRRKVNEDTDLGIRLCLAGFKYGLRGRAVTKAPESLREWIAQRERWSIGGTEVLLDHFWEVLKRPKLWLPFLILFYPAIVGVIISALLPESIVVKLAYLLLPAIAVVSSKLASVAILAVFELNLIRNLLVSIASFAAWSGFVAFSSRRFNFKIDYRVLPIYYFVYSPFWTFVCFISFIRVLFGRIMGKKVVPPDWKV